MFSNKNLSQKNTFKNKNLKALKQLYAIKKIKNNLIQPTSFSFLFFYDFLSNENKILLKNCLNDENLKAIQIKKNLFKNTDHFFVENFFENLIKNNVLLIVPKNLNITFSFKTLQKLNNFKNLHFLGFFSNLKFYRPTEVKKLSGLTPYNVQKNLIQIIQHQQQELKITLSLKK